MQQAAKVLRLNPVHGNSISIRSLGIAMAEMLLEADLKQLQKDATACKDTLEEQPQLRAAATSATGTLPGHYDGIGVAHATPTPDSGPTTTCAAPQHARDPRSQVS